MHPFLDRRQVVDVGQPPAGAGEAVERRLGLGTDGVEPGAQESRPVVRMHGVQVRDHVIEGIGPGLPDAVLDAVEGLGEIIERLAVVGGLADQGVGVQPDQQGLAVVVAGAAHP